MKKQKTKKACSCKSSKDVYCIIDEDKNTLHRITFSRSLAEHIIETTNGYKLQIAQYVRTRKLRNGERSNALYGIIASAKDLILRIQIRQELAEIYVNDESRHIEEIYLQYV